MTPAKSYPYAVVNVSTTEPLSRNSLPVFPDASEFDLEMMQKIAMELNLTESAFRASGVQIGLGGSRAHMYATKETSFPGRPIVATGLVLLQKGYLAESVGKIYR